MPKNFPPDGIVVDNGTWGVDLDHTNQALAGFSNRIGEGMVHMLDTSTFSGFSNGFTPLESSQVYEARFLIRSNSVVAGRTFLLRHITYSYNKSPVTTTNVLSGVLPSANVWHDIRSILEANGQYVRLTVSKNSGNPGYQGFVDYIGVRRIARSFSAYGSVATSIPSGAYTKVRFDTENWDHGLQYTGGSTSQMTAKYDSRWHFDTAVTLDNPDAGKLMRLAFYVNTTLVLAGHFAEIYHIGAVGDVAVSLSGDLYLNAGDTVEVRCLQTSVAAHSTLASQQQTWFTGHEIP